MQHGHEPVTKKLWASVALTLVATMFTPLSTAHSAAQPNVIMILMDDMNDYDLQWMPATRQLLATPGANVTDFLSMHPLCCPARAMLLTGQYAQNNGVHNNTGPWNGTAFTGTDNTIGTWVHNAGYRTAFIGKLFNLYQVDHNWLGWDDFDPIYKCNFCAYNMTYWDNGNPVKITDYTTNYTRDRTVADINRYASHNHPFFIWSSVTADHDMKMRKKDPIGPPIPAPKDLNTMNGVPLPAENKPSFFKDQPYYSTTNPITVDMERNEFHRRIESLQSVDRMVRKVVSTLSADGVLNNTYIIFTCDNGYLLGEHNLEGKNMPYEEDMQIPFLIRGPGIPHGAVNKTMNLVDVPPTIEQITGATPGRAQDGKSIIPVINGGDGYDATLIQAGAETEPWSYRGIRDGQWTYVEHSDGTKELYDRNADPYELTNLAGQRPDVEADFKARLAILKNCAGAACQNG